MWDKMCFILFVAKLSAETKINRLTHDWFFVKCLQKTWVLFLIRCAHDIRSNYAQSLLKNAIREVQGANVLRVERMGA
jgi:hypothetical protein